MCAVNMSALSIGARSRWILAMTLNAPRTLMVDYQQRRQALENWCTDGTAFAVAQQR
jgi:hypothetical protein